MAFHLASIARIKHYYLKGVLAIYIVAFASLYFQVKSLFGDNGVVPLNTKRPLDPKSILTFAPELGLSYSEFTEFLCLVSILLASVSMFVRRLSNAFTFGLLWYVYYSICLVGQGFMSFHSDLMLLEVGFITILLAPLFPTSRMSQSDHDHLSMFLVKWLVFRYFITNVLNVYLDNDDAWYNMTAIPMVAQGVQFPSLFSWHVFNAPSEYVKLYQAYEHSVKLCAPFLMLFDLKYSRLLGFYTLLFVALPSALFFNFGWTDLLIVVCLLSFLKDAYYYDDKRAKQSTLRSIVDILFVFAYIGAVVFLLVKYFGVKFENNILKCQVMFTPIQFKLFADHLVPASLVFGLLGLINASYTAYFRSSKKTSIIKTLLYTAIVVPLFLSTFPTMTRFAPGLEGKIKPIALTKDLNRAVAPYMLSNNYIILSKVSHFYADHRPELQLQARLSKEDPTWQQYNLRYKLGKLDRGLSIVVPHIPRIDLKFWYAARSSLQNNQWLYNFAHLVASKSPAMFDVLARDTLLGQVGQVRVDLLAYKYASKAGHWSQVSKVRSEYLPATSVESLKSLINKAKYV